MSNNKLSQGLLRIYCFAINRVDDFRHTRLFKALNDQRGDVPGWVLVVLMTTGLVTAIWTIAAPRLTAILKNSLDGIR